MTNETTPKVKKLSAEAAQKLLAKTADEGTANACKTTAEVVSTLASYGVVVEIED